MPAERDPEFEGLIDYLHRTRGFDFSGYKRSTLMRRMQRREWWWRGNGVGSWKGNAVSLEDARQ